MIKSCFGIIFSFSILLGAADAVCVNAQNRPDKKKPGMVLIEGATFEMGTDKAEIPKLQELFKIKRALRAKHFG